MQSHQLINQTSGETEYYTPGFIIDAAKEVMGRIYLDPASSQKANQTVGAWQYYTADDRPIGRDWQAETVWMNHPFNRGEQPCKPNCKKKTCVLRGHCISEPIPSNAEWIDKLITEFYRSHIGQAMCITYACTSEEWFRPLFDYPMCFLQPRTNYLLPDGTVLAGVTKGSVVTYLCRNKYQTSSFRDVFRKYGRVMFPADNWGGGN